MGNGFISPRAILNAFSSLPANLFNSALKIVRLDSLGRLPAVDGSQLTNINVGGGPTVGAGGIYPTVGDALADNKYFMRIVGDATETGNLLLPQNTFINVDPNVEWDLGEYHIDYDDDIVDFTIKFDSALTSKIIWSPTSAGAMIRSNGHTDLGASLSNVIIDQSSAVANCPLFDAGIDRALLMSGVNTIELPNVSGCGIQLAASQRLNCKGTLVLKRVGTGTACENFLTGEINVSDLILDGDFKAGASHISTTGGTIKTITCVDKVAGPAFNLYIGGEFLSLKSTLGLSALNVYANANRISINSANLNIGNLDLGAYNNAVIHAARSTGALIMSNVNCSNNNISQCSFDGALVVDGDDNKFGFSSFFGGYTDNGNRNARTSVVSAVGGQAITDCGIF